MKDTSRLMAAEIYQRFSKSANVAARRLLLNGGDRQVVNDFKLLHAAITYKAIERHRANCDGWVEVVCGHRSPALEGVDDRHCRV